MTPINKWSQEKKNFIPAQSHNAASLTRDYVNSMNRNDQAPWVIPTSVKKLNDALNGGLMQGRSTIVAGVPGSGKTAFCTQMAWQAASLGVRVGYMSLELDERRLLHRILSIVTGIPADRIAKRQYKDQHEINHVLDTARLLAEPLSNIQLLTIPDIGNDGDVWQLDISSMRLTIEKLRDEHGLQILILDYLQLAFDEDIKKAVAFSRFLLTSVPRSYKIHVLVAGQVSAKKIAMRNIKVPGAGDVDWAGEAQADTVFFTHRDYLYTGLKSDLSRASLVVTKNRDGAFYGTVEAKFNGSRFADKE